jgi:hypothetical protein
MEIEISGILIWPPLIFLNLFHDLSPGSYRHILYLFSLTQVHTRTKKMKGNWVELQGPWPLPLGSHKSALGNGELYRMQNCSCGCLIALEIVYHISFTGKNARQALYHLSHSNSPHWIASEALMPMSNKVYNLQGKSQSLLSCKISSRDEKTWGQILQTGLIWLSQRPTSSFLSIHLAWQGPKVLTGSVHLAQGCKWTHSAGH